MVGDGGTWTGQLHPKRVFMFLDRREHVGPEKDVLQKCQGLREVAKEEEEN